VEEVVGWLKKPAAERPAVIAFYFEETNTAGHEDGPDSPALIAAVRLLDDRLGALRARLEHEGIAANFVIVSDHGMMPAPRTQTVILDDYVDVKTIQVDADGSDVCLRPIQGDVASLESALAKMPHAKVYRAENLPAQLHITANPRVAPLWILPEPGWRAMTRAAFNKPQKRALIADHGYDPAVEAMHATFIVNGPSFRHDGAVIEPVENIHIYNLMCAALGLKPAPNDGDDRLVRALLRK
jgi:predicted AlkP superfamily pyrophosphatase or phosphodiesterase